MKDIVYVYEEIDPYDGKCIVCCKIVDGHIFILNVEVDIL